MKLLFHGSSVSADKIYEYEYGLDMRYSDPRGGVFGHGIYFAMGADYSHRYSYRNGSFWEMFVVFVI